MSDQPKQLILKREDWITNFKKSNIGKEAIDAIKNLEDDNRGPDKIEQLTQEILNTCFTYAIHKRNNDLGKINKKIDSESLKVDSLLKLLKNNIPSAQIKEQNFTELLAKNGLTISDISTDTEAKPIQLLEVIIQSLRDSTCFIKEVDSIASLNYGEDTSDNTHQPGTEIILIYHLALLIEYWPTECGSLLPGAMLSRQFASRYSPLKYYDIIALLVNGTLHTNFSPASIQEKLKKHLKRNRDTSFLPPMID